MSTQSNIDKFVYWINERYCVYRLKEGGESKPWSQDPVFHNTYFCNVHRENDRVTKWIRENFNHGHLEKPEFNMILARMVNKPSSLNDMGWPFDKWTGQSGDRFVYVMSQPGSWGGAYIVSTNGRSMPKHEYISGLLSAAVSHCEQVGKATTCQAAHVALMRVQGLASFMAAQVVADLKNTPFHPLREAEDWWTFVAPGPGSLRGMTWIYGDPNEGKDLKARDFHRCMPYLRDYVDEKLNYDVMPRFCNQDLQNCLCEFDKYMRVSTGTGRSKRKYNGT